MNKIKSIFKHLIEDESGQGATEYILILVIVVAIAIAFRGQLEPMLEQASATLSDRIQGFVSQ